MTNVECHANDECRIKELYPYLINPKSDIPILTIRIPQSDVSDLSLSISLICQHAMHYALCPLPKFPTSAIGHLCPMLKIHTSEFRIPHSDFPLQKSTFYPLPVTFSPLFSGSSLYPMRFALSALPFSNFRIPTSDFRPLPSVISSHHLPQLPYGNSRDQNNRCHGGNHRTQT
jgi:hypothetical protein